MIDLDSGNDLIEIYDKFWSSVKSSLVHSGAYIPSGLPGKRRSKPLWWDPECKNALDRRREARKDYLACQTHEMRDKFRSVDNEVKWFLRKKKKTSFVKFCDFINPSMGLKDIWGKVKSISNASHPLRTGICNDPQSEIFKKLQDDLANEHIPLSNLPFVPEPHIEDRFNRPITRREYELALSQCKKNTSPFCRLYFPR